MGRQAGRSVGGRGQGRTIPGILNKKGGSLLEGEGDKFAQLPEDEDGLDARRDQERREGEGERARPQWVALKALAMALEIRPSLRRRRWWQQRWIPEAMLPIQSAWHSDEKALMLCDERVARSGPGNLHRKHLGSRDLSLIHI